MLFAEASELRFNLWLRTMNNLWSEVTGWVSIFSGVLDNCYYAGRVKYHHLAWFSLFRSTPPFQHLLITSKQASNIIKHIQRLVAEACCSSTSLIFAFNLIRSTLVSYLILLIIFLIFLLCYKPDSYSQWDFIVVKVIIMNILYHYNH